MIVFDLDNTLANCEHRRHFVDPQKNNKYMWRKSNIFSKDIPIDNGFYDEAGCRFVANWPAFYEACNKDEPIKDVIYVLNAFYNDDEKISIWSGRCESIRNKTKKWIDKYIGLHSIDELKMRPVGDNTPDDVLKERWLQELLQESMSQCLDGKKSWHKGIKEIDFVFDSDPKSISMWRRRGIFVFNCLQRDGEF